MTSLPAALPAAAPRHGGDLAAARRRFPAAPQPWIDLSTGINPVGFPVPALDPAVWAGLPDGDALDGLERAAARAYGAGPATAVVAAAGTQALLAALVRDRPAARVAVLGFGYAEHPAVWRAAGAAVRIVDDLEALAQAEVAVVVNPNNPDGRTVPPAALRALAAGLGRRGGLLVVDEAFADVAPALSLAEDRPSAALVLRSVGKLYGLAGLRLAFALADPAPAARLRARLGPWPVSGPAIAAGTAALADAAWRDAARARLARDAARLDGLLAAAGLAVIGGTPLFRLVETRAAAAWADRLGRAGVLVRRFAERPAWLRFGLPGAEPAWARLADALAGPERWSKTGLDGIG